MKVEVAVVRWEEIDLVDALANHRIAWDYDVVTGGFAEQYYPAEADDVFLEITQDLINTWDGGNDSHRIAWLECASLMPSLVGVRGSAANRLVVEYIRDNIDRVIDTDKTGGHW
jgi:hypothetical protein